MNGITTFILAGGNDLIAPGYGRRLNDALAKYVTQPKVLSCFFSAPESDWPTKCANWHEWFLANFEPGFTYDYAKPATFLQQIDEADVIYLHGGNTQLLFDTLPDADQLKQHFKGKVIVGSSAGANVLSKNYWSSTQAKPGHGLGIVDVNVMVHYGSLKHEGRARTLEDWDKEETQFREFIGAGEIIHIPEGQFIVKEVEL